MDEQVCMCRGRGEPVQLLGGACGRGVWAGGRPLLDRAGVRGRHVCMSLCRKVTSRPGRRNNGAAMSASRGGRW